MIFRPLLTVVLCSVVAFGHAPAWMHVATCGEASGTHLDDNAIGVSHQSCCKHSNPFAGRIGLKISSDRHHGDASHQSQSRCLAESSPCSSNPAGEHSSDDCVICLSLMSAIGHIELGRPDCVALESLYLASVNTSDLLSEGVARALHLRGPPGC